MAMEKNSQNSDAHSIFKRTKNKSFISPTVELYYVLGDSGVVHEAGDKV